MLPVEEYKEGDYLLMATENGLIKKTPLSQFQDVRANGLIAIKLNVSSPSTVVAYWQDLPQFLLLLADWSDLPQSAIGCALRKLHAETRGSLFVGNTSSVACIAFVQRCEPQ